MKNDVKSKALKILDFTLNQQAADPVVLDMKGPANLCDYFVIVSGETPTQVCAIYDEVLKQSKKNKIKVHHTQTDKSYQWMVVDFFDVIVHIFNKEAREFYNIEGLWEEAKKVKIPKPKKLS